MVCAYPKLTLLNAMLQYRTALAISGGPGLKKYTRPLDNQDNCSALIAFSLGRADYHPASGLSVACGAGLRAACWEVRTGVGHTKKGFVFPICLQGPSMNGRRPSRAFRKSLISRLPHSVMGSPGNHNRFAGVRGRNNFIRIYEMLY
jgi:hypothetical protein